MQVVLRQILRPDLTAVGGALFGVFGVDVVHLEVKVEHLVDLEREFEEALAGELPLKVLLHVLLRQQHMAAGADVVDGVKLRVFDPLPLNGNAQYPLWTVGE